MCQFVRLQFRNGSRRSDSVAETYLKAIAWDSGYQYYPQAMLSFGSEKSRQLFLLAVILLVGASLRLYQLDTVPPGLTHDEADHGLDAWAIVEGNRPVYLPTANGREPLYDYATAILMRIIGRHYLAGRLTATFFGVIFLAASYGWSKQLFSKHVAVLATFALAVGFWPVMISRHMLRTITLPTLLTLALLVFIRAHKKSSWSLTMGAGFLLGLSLYSYIPARALWILLPLLAGCWVMTGRYTWPKLKYSALALLTAASVAVPLFNYLRENPAAEARIDQLQRPLETALQGDFGPLWQNIRASLELFFLTGDMAWRYNLAGQPWLGPLSGFLFVAGLFLAIGYVVQRDRRYAAGALVALAWLIIGFVPVGITGPELATTQAVGLLPVLYIFPALALAQGWQQLSRRVPAGRSIYLLLIAVGYLLMSVQTAQDYFGQWAHHPEVRLQYEATLVTALNALEADGLTEAAISTARPGRFHAQAVAALVIRDDPARFQWFNGTSALAWPGDTGYLVSSGLAPLRDEFVDSAQRSEFASPEDDIDRPIYLYPAAAIQLPPFSSLPTAYRFGEAVDLAGFWLESTQLQPGGLVRYMTSWDIQLRPAEEWVLFTHVSGVDGVPVAQQDLLAVPSDGWRHGDLFYQLHEVQLPDDLPAGEYVIRSGFYFCPTSCEAGTTRINVHNLSAADGPTPVGDILDVTTISVGAGS